MGHKIESLPPHLQAMLKAQHPELFNPKGQVHQNRRGKFNAKKGYSVHLDRTFHSRLERDRADILWARQRDGLITDLQFQAPIPVGELTWKVDFLYKEKGITWAEDAKGAEDQRFKAVKTVYLERGPYPLRISKRRKKTWTIETIIPAQLPEDLKQKISQLES